MFCPLPIFILPSAAGGVFLVCFCFGFWVCFCFLFLFVWGRGYAKKTLLINVCTWQKTVTSFTGSAWSLQTLGHFLNTSHYQQLSVVLPSLICSFSPTHVFLHKFKSRHHYLIYRSGKLSCLYGWKRSKLMCLGKSWDDSKFCWRKWPCWMFVTQHAL